METRYFYLLRFTLALTDLIIVNLCFYLGFYLSNKYFVPLDKSMFSNNVILCNLLWLITTGIFKLYSKTTIHVLEYIYKATWKSYVLHLTLLSAYFFFSSSLNMPKHFFIIFYGLLFLSFLMSRFTGTALQSALNENFDIRKKVAVLNMNDQGEELANYIKQQGSFNFAGFLEEETLSVNAHGDLVMPSAINQLKSAVSAGIQEVFVSLDTNRMTEVSNLIVEAEKQCIKLMFVPDTRYMEANFKLARMGEYTVFSARKEALEAVENRFKKRAFDIIVSGTVLIFILSWLYPLLGIIIKLTSPGPVMFKQLRTGRDNKPFWCYKFRSMSVNNDSDKRQASKSDIRVTPIGRFLRKTSLDEFPQFLNVLYGHMSIIGPRPHMLSHTEQYRQLIDKYMVRQFLKPGISGWAQVNGYRGETSETVLMEKRVEHDIHYMTNWSLMFDIKIMFLTVINIFRGEKNAF
ncbi:putative colanic acid biosynthesis UDP-glucose lipid carrier transferase [Mucilaginibacter sp. UYNi724]